MRNYIDIISEARKAKAPASEPVNLKSLLDHLKLLSTKLAQHPFDIVWNTKYAHDLQARVASVIDHHDAEEDGQADFSDLWIEYLQTCYASLTLDTFYDVRRDVEYMEREYHERHAERMQDETGYRDPMHYVESSDWLTAMKLQTETAKTLSLIKLNKFENVATVLSTLDNFVDGWKAANDQSVILTEGMQKGIAAIIPLLMLVVQRSM